jgi:hypothetical protein
MFVYPANFAATPFEPNSQRYPIAVDERMRPLSERFLIEEWSTRHFVDALNSAQCKDV